MRILVLADTHVPDHARELPPRLARPLRRAELILHAGDVTSPEVIDELEAHAPVHVAMGNNDGPDVRDRGARDEVRLEVDDVRIAMVHDAGRREGRERRLHRRFPDVDIVVFGHSHVPVDARHHGMRLFNPGSPTWKRRQPVATYGWVTITAQGIRTRIVPLEP